MKKYSSAYLRWILASPCWNEIEETWKAEKIYVFFGWKREWRILRSLLISKALESLFVRLDQVQATVFYGKTTSQNVENERDSWVQREIVCVRVWERESKKNV